MPSQEIAILPHLITASLSQLGKEASASGDCSPRNPRLCVCVHMCLCAHMGVCAHTQRKMSQATTSRLSRPCLTPPPPRESWAQGLQVPRYPQAEGRGCSKAQLPMAGMTPLSHFPKALGSWSPQRPAQRERSLWSTSPCSGLERQCEPMAPPSW